MKFISTNGKTVEILKKYNLFPRKNFGQNFIIDPSVVIKIAKESCDKSTTTLEIGPGIGALSEQLCIYSKNLIAYEIDNNLIGILNENLASYDNFKIINQDFLKADLSFLKDVEIVVCANLPYYITTAILFKLFESDLKIKSINVMMQKEVGDRLMASENTENYSALSVIVQYLYDVKKMMKISKDVFLPKPSVESVVLTLKPRFKENINQELFFEFVKQSFGQRRKTIFNNLKKYLNEDKLNKLNLKYDLKKRAQEFSLAEFIKMFKEVCDE